MKMNLATRLGLIAAGHLALHSGDGWVKVGTIVEEYGVPEMYLLKIMQQMVKANLLRSKKGPRGGFQLGRPAHEITLIEIIEVAEGPVDDRSELADMQEKALFNSSFEGVINRAFDKAVSILSKATLAQMVGNPRSTK